jgi:hypothetical protein
LDVDPDRRLAEEQVVPVLLTHLVELRAHHRVLVLDIRVAGRDTGGGVVVAVEHRRGEGGRQIVVRVEVQTAVAVK